MTQINGNIIYLTKKSILDNFGNETLKKVIASMNNEYSAVISESIDSSKMYDIEPFFEFQAAIENTLGRDVVKKMEEEHVKRQIKGLYGLIIKFVSVDKIISRGQEYWNKMYSGGKINTRMEGNKTIFHITEFDFLNDSALFASTWYLKTFVEEVKGKKGTVTAKKIDKTTTEIIITDI